MKKYIFTLMALVATMSIQAQLVKVYENGTLKASYYNIPAKKYKVVFEEADANLLPGEFSVSATKKVMFTKGNLQATYSTSTSSYTWGFAANQYDYVGNKAGNTSINSQKDGAVVDLFGFSTSTTNYGISTSTNNGTYSGAFKDWGTLFDDKYYTLSNSEWTYLLNNRSQTNRYAKAMVNGVKGLLIFPDNYNGTTAASGTGIAGVNSTSASFPTTSIPTETWTTMESNGVVFLPAAGRRAGSNLTSTDGWYWSSTIYDSNQGYYMIFSSSEVSPNRSDGDRSSSRSVRLVLDVSK